MRWPALILAVGAVVALVVVGAVVAWLYVEVRLEERDHQRRIDAELARMNETDR